MPSLALLFFLPFSSQGHLWLSPTSSQRPGESDDAIHTGDGVTGESASCGADREEKGGAGVWRDKQRMSSPGGGGDQGCSWDALPHNKSAQNSG